MNTLSFKVLPSAESNDHQARVLIDGDDWLGEESLGVDPHRLFRQDTFMGGTLLIGRCECGAEGCDDVFVDVKENKNKIIWRGKSGLDLEFEKADYINAVEGAKMDFSWEDINRRVERLVGDIFTGTETVDGLSFEWASCRLKNKKVGLSFIKKEGERVLGQEIMEIDWDGESEADAIKNANTLLENSDRIKK